MVDFNAKVGRNNASIERIMGKEGLGDVNENDEELVDIQRWRTSLQDVRVNRGTTIGFDHHLVVASLKIKLAARKPFMSIRRTFDVIKLRDPDTKQASKLELQNRFESLFLQEEEEDEKDGRAKEILNDARTRQGKREANRYCNEKNREVKKSCRRDKRNLIEGIAREAEDVAKNNDLRTLYMTTRKLSGIRCNRNRPIRSEDGTLLTKMKDQLQRWKKHFESVLNRPAPSQLPDPRPADVPLNINTGPISRGEIRTALAQLKSAKAPGVDNIPPEALKEGGPCILDAHCIEF
ncbi:uncharacterized protein [Montipora foliosa]|uniref:uncharacterized protein n=1 Tax=Montipora foliosa TaxID=591990 RepID=UPI0035F112CE